jgi:hypothetical protein
MPLAWCGGCGVNTLVYAGSTPSAQELGSKTGLAKSAQQEKQLLASTCTSWLVEAEVYRR